MTLLPRQKNGCPYLLLAPMEGVADRAFRRAIATIGGFQEAVTEFIRVPTNAHVASLCKVYHAEELDTVPLAAQIMGSDLELMASMAQALQARGARRIDVNCGCPSNVVTGRGAGSGLLKDPKALFEVVSSVVKAVSIPVTCKMRSGFYDTALFEENLKAAEATGIAFLTLHPRTKQDGYGPPAKWELIAKAKSLLKVPVVGNGDIKTCQDALRIQSETGCDALMIGRGAVSDPFIFQKIQAHYNKSLYRPRWEKIELFFTTYFAELPVEMTGRAKINKLKQLINFLFSQADELQEKRSGILRETGCDFDAFYTKTKEELKFYYNK
jgi:nifR3 family TIM-barrel protein